VPKIAFTGSDVSGQKIYESAAKSIKHVSLELGGKSPNIVFADADLDAAVMGAISGIFAATGQTCIAGSRLLLQRSIHDTFVAKLIEVARSARIGDPMSLDTHVGPVTTPPQYKKVLDYIEIAKREGANCVLGGGPYRGPGAKGSQFPGGSVRPGAVGDPVRGRGGGASARQRHRVRARGRRVDQGHGTRAAPGGEAARRHRVGEHLSGGELHVAVRRL
jgi:aldehyde dehydrogenase (NAD+)